MGDGDSPFGCSQSSVASLVPSGSPSNRRCSSSSPASSRGKEDVMELQQDDRQLADLAKVIGWIKEVVVWNPLSVRVIL